MIIRILAMVSVLAVTNPAWAEFRIMTWTFDGDEAGGPPSGFSPATGDAGRWEVTADPKSSSKPNVLARIPAGKLSDAPQVLFLEKAEAGNLELTMRVKLASIDEGQGAGLVFRAVDERNYYVVWISPKDKQFRFDRVVNGEMKPLQDQFLESMETGKWYNLRVSIHGPILEAFVDNRFLSGREDGWAHANYKKGKIGLWARGPGVVSFDTVRLTPMDGGTGTAALPGTETTIIK